MTRRFDSSGAGAGLGLKMPSKALQGVMLGLLAIWLIFALGVNWGGASEAVFLLFCGNTEAILGGEVWRLVTAPLMHAPTGTISHILYALLGLFFLTPALEDAWGTPRTLRFLALSGVVAYAVQLLIGLLLPARLAAQLVPTYWYGAMPVIEAVAIAWALTFRGQTVRLWMMVPVTSQTLVVFVVAISVLRVIANSQAPEGLLSPFGGIFAGWLLGAGTPSPLRRAYLRLRLAQLDREAVKARGRPGSARAGRVGTAGGAGSTGGASATGKAGRAALRVIEGGKGSDRDNSGGGMLH